MPYIRQTLREILDPYVEDLKNGHINVWDFCEYINAFPLEIQDGCLNYVITKALLEEHNLKMDIVEEILLVFYTPDGLPRYWMYNRLLGLLTSMDMEFERRGWYSYGFFKAMINRVYTFSVGPYEEKAIGRNGDILG